jgi:CRP-like cAMP-binding protein
MILLYDQHHRFFRKSDKKSHFYYQSSDKIQAMNDRLTDEKSDTTVHKKSIADLFNGLPYRHFPAKHMIIYQGDKADRIYYIISGYVRMYNITQKGNERTMAILGPGESLPLIQSETTQNFYDALTEVEAAYGTYEEIVNRFLADKAYMEVARDASVQIMQRVFDQMEILSNDSAAEKVELALKFLAKYYGEEHSGYRRIKFKVTHQELANLVNLTRETVSQTINKLEKKKLIRIGDSGYLLVVDASAKNVDNKGSNDKASVLKLPTTLRGYRPSGSRVT